MANKYKKTSKATVVFTDLAAHELRTPITHIIGFSEVLQNKKISSNTELREKYLRIIINNAKRLNNILSNIIDLAKFDLGKFELVYERIDLSKLVDEIKIVINPALRKKKLKARYEIESNLHIMADSERLKQVLLNILTNAITFTPKGFMLLKIRKEGNKIHFSMKDTGIGIAKKNLNKIFERFHSLEPVATRTHGGIGLGLYVSKQIVEAHRGKIWAESKGKGSTFHVLLPIKK